jgi:SAM-dependent methyltransferase
MGDLAGHATFNALLQPDVAEEAFAFVDPPFNFNAPEIAKWPAEVTGHFLLNCLCQRLGWSSLTGRRLLDFGCGVRFTRTIINLSMDIDFYAGIDTNKEVISWLKSEIRDRGFRFEHLDMFNHMYRVDGSSSVDEGALQNLALGDFDAACMFSVITHQVPKDSELIFKLLYRCVKPGGSLYFTAFIDEAVRDYVERDPSNPCHMSTYHPDFLIGLVRGSGWRVEKVCLKSLLQQTAFVCRKALSD